MLNMILKELSEKEGPILIFDGKQFITGQTLFDAGICACPDCGYLMPIEHKWCKHCKQKVFIIVARIAGKK